MKCISYHTHIYFKSHIFIYQMITICILDKISTLLKTYITKTVLALLVLFIGFSLKAQDVDIDSLNSALFNYLNSQRIAAGMEDLV